MQRERKRVKQQLLVQTCQIEPDCSNIMHLQIAHIQILNAIAQRHSSTASFNKNNHTHTVRTIRDGELN